MPLGYMPEALDYLHPAIWTGFVRGLPLPKEHIGDSLLPRRDVPGDELEWDIFADEAPIAPMVAPGAEFPPTDGAQFRRAWAEIVKTGVRRDLRSQDVRILRNFGDAYPTTAVGQMRAAAEAKIRNEVVRVSQMVDTRIEYLQLSALQGSIVITPDEYTDVSLNLSIPVNHQTTATGWDDLTNSDPLGDIQRWIRFLRYTAKTLVIPYEQLWNLQRNHQIRLQVFANTAAGAATRTFLPVTELQTILQGEFGLDLREYHSVYTTRTFDGNRYVYTARRFLPSNRIILLPDQPVGYTAEAPAEENDFQTGKFAWIEDPAQTGRRNPWVYRCFCGWNGFPVIQTPDRIIVADVQVAPADAWTI